MNVSYTLKKAVLRKGKIDEDSSYMTFFVENIIKDKEYNSFFDDFPENAFSSLEEELKYISDKYQKLCALFVENRIVTADKFYEATEYISYYNLTKLYIYIQKQNIQTFNNIDLYSTCTTMLVEQNTKEKVAQSRRENQKKYLKELLARYETVATKIEVMAVIVKLKKLGFLARIRILENELNIREKKKKRFYLLWL